MSRQIVQRCIIFPVFCLAVIMLVCMHGYAETEGARRHGDPATHAGKGNKAGTDNYAGEAKQASKREVDTVVPRQRERVSLLAALGIDLVIPGGGSLFYGNYYYGATFAVLKIAGAYSIYYYYREWEYYRSLYYASRKANKSLDPGHELHFKVPGGGYKSVTELRYEYDRAAHYITFAVLANAIVYGISLIVTYNGVQKINERALPTFELSLYCDRLIGTLAQENHITLQCTYRI